MMTSVRRAQLKTFLIRSGLQDLPVNRAPQNNHFEPASDLCPFLGTTLDGAVRPVTPGFCAEVSKPFEDNSRRSERRLLPNIGREAFPLAGGEVAPPLNDFVGCQMLLV